MACNIFVVYSEVDMEEIVKNILADIWSLQLSVVGIAVSVITLLFASHVGKAETYQHVSKRKVDVNDEYLGIYLQNGMKTYRRLSSQILWLLVVTMLAFVYTTVVKYIDYGCSKKWMALVDAVLTIVILMWSVCIVVRVYKQYKNETK